MHEATSGCNFIFLEFPPNFPTPVTLKAGADNRCLKPVHARYSRATNRTYEANNEFGVC